MDTSLDTGLVGRTTELAQLRSFLDGLGGGGDRCALVVGDPGVGKSALLDAVRGQAQRSGALVLSVQGVEAERNLPFAGLYQLLAPLTAHLPSLPAGQRAAAETALGLRDGHPPASALMGSAALSLVTTAAAMQDVVIVVDDLSWVDPSTQAVLAFIARRITDHRIALIAATRPRYAGALADFRTELELGPLASDVAEQLLLRGHPHLDPRTADFFLAEAQGNPLALVELPRCLSRISRIPGAELATDLPLSRRLRQTFGGPLPALPSATRAALLVAAAYAGPRAALVLTAASAVLGSAVTVHDLEPAQEAGLLELVGTTVIFRHPLVRWVVLDQETASRRLAAHAALAEELALSPTTRLWHRACATVEHDDQVADELAALANETSLRDPVHRTVRCLQRSAELTRDPVCRGHRYATAAVHSLRADDVDATDELVTLAVELPLSGKDRLWLDWVREVMGDAEAADQHQVRRLCQLAGAAAAFGDHGLALDVLLDAALQCSWSRPAEEPRHLVYRALSGLTSQRNEPRYVAAFALTGPPLTAPLTAVRFADVEKAQVHTAQLDDVQVLRALGFAAHALGDSPRAIDYLQRASLGLRREGAIRQLVPVLVATAADQLVTGDWHGAAAGLDEAQHVRVKTGGSAWHAALLTCRARSAALRGDLTLALELAGQAESAALDHRLSALVGSIRLAKGCAWAGVGRFTEAYAELRSLFTFEDQSAEVRLLAPALMFLAEAAVHTDRRLEALPVIDRWAEFASVSPAPDLRVHLSFARAVLADHDTAELHYEAALSQDLQGWPFVRAMLQAAFGAWLRRQRRIVESRGQTRSALVTFDLIGARGWAARARSELAAAGEREEASSSARTVLSPQQLEIARLVAHGLSNREIGEQLFLSPRTVGSHLYRMFPKLGVTSRVQLAQRLGRPSPEENAGAKWPRRYPSVEVSMTKR